MPNPLKGQTPLTLEDGREFTLVLDFEALVQGEAAYGKPLPLMIAEAKAGMIGASRAILFGALRTLHPEITLRDASEMMRTDGERVEAAMEAAGDAAYPDLAEDGDRGNAQSGRPGRTSGGSGARPGSSQRRSGSKPRERST